MDARLLPRWQAAESDKRKERDTQVLHHWVRRIRLHEALLLAEVPNSLADLVSYRAGSASLHGDRTVRTIEEHRIRILLTCFGGRQEGHPICAT